MYNYLYIKKQDNFSIPVRTVVLNEYNMLECKWEKLDLSTPLILQPEL